MRAVVIREFGGPEVLEVVETPLPEPGPGEVRVRVAAAGLNPADLAVRAGLLGAGALVPGAFLGLGWDVAGTVDALGAGVSGFTTGTAVVGSAGGFGRRIKAHAEYVVLDADAVAAAPSSVDPVHAATLPTNALTADQALGLLGARPGDRVLVTGAAGAVGGYAVQLARHAGLRVIALARPADAPLLRELGADEAVSSLDRVRADAVLDAAGLGAPALAAVPDGGGYVTVRPDAVPAAERGIRVAAVQVRPDGVRLAELVALLDRGVLTTRVADTYPLAEAAKAHARLAEGGVRGRLMLVP
ncbi:NADP-dependent oxidoreductase [Streptomyces sp. NPDC026673]|uniref:NADP-dependent oxidoreductase n=1 Tax=Streptomyces sp. NPDC026673 TaxID=3155724 RepID=UPI0033E632F8